MKLKEVVVKAIENGFPYGGVVYVRAVRHASGDWDLVTAEGHLLRVRYDLLDNFCAYALRPLFWQSLGKAMGWNRSDSILVEGWKFHWHVFIDHLAEGGTAETYFETLK